MCDAHARARAVQLAERFASETDLLPYLLDGCKRQDFDATQLYVRARLARVSLADRVCAAAINSYCGELLAIMLQTSDKVIDTAAAKLGALDSLLRAVAVCAGERAAHRACGS